jgi:hypothetical protein
VNQPKGEARATDWNHAWEELEMRTVCGVKIRISDQALLDDLVESLRRANCPVEVTGPQTLVVDSPSRLLTPEQARREIGFYLAVWQVRHPDALVTVAG